MATLLALLAAGCGGEDEGRPIPASLREQLESRLEETENRLDARVVGACDDIDNDTEPEVERILTSLPSDTDADIRQRLEDGFQRLWDLVRQECDELRNQETEPETTPEPAPLPEETAPETVPTTPEPEPDEGDEGDGDAGGGDGAGGGGGSGGGGGGGSGGGGPTDGQGGIDLPGADGGGTVAPGAG